jgi:hypothetical protein
MDGSEVKRTFLGSVLSTHMVANTHL